MFHVFKFSARYSFLVIAAVVCTLICFAKIPAKPDLIESAISKSISESAEVGSNIDTTSPKTVYLTFDDGPSKNTAHLLDILEKHDVPATFFIVGPVDNIKNNYQELLTRIYSQGHTLAPHSFSHDYKKIYSSKENFFNDYYKITSAIQQITDNASGIYRFPGGSVNREAPPEVLTQIVLELKKQDIIFYDWNIVSGDDTAVVYSPQILYNNVMKDIGRFKNAVVLFHDATLCTTTADAVDLLIPELKKQGWKFEAITKETKPIQYHTS